MPEEPTELTTALIAGLAIQANELTEATDRAAETFRFSRVLKVVMVGLLVLFVLQLVATALLVAVALQNRRNGADIKAATSTILDCTTPGGKCYQSGNARTAAAVGQIVSAVNTHTDAAMITTQCSNRHPHDRAFARCLRVNGVRVPRGGSDG